MISHDGRDLKLESGSLATVLRWEKTTEVLCMLLEGQQLRNALRAQARTRLWSYCDLSPDCRAIEQFGMGIEYAGISFLRMGNSDVLPELAFMGRICGDACSVTWGVELGFDGCPMAIEWSRRVFVPMLEAIGPKYAGTVDCFMRILQVYGSTVAQLMDPAFEFASAERSGVGIPLLDFLEGITSDAGGEVHKTGTDHLLGDFSIF